MIVEYHVLDRYSGRAQIGGELFAAWTYAGGVAAIVYMHSWYGRIDYLNPRIICRRADDRVLAAWIVECAERVGRGIDRECGDIGPIQGIQISHRGAV